MFKILKYSFIDILNSRLIIIYSLFFLATTFGLLNFSGDLSKGLVSLMNVLLLIVPLISTVFGVMYFYNSREFIELLLCQPIKRKKVFLGLFLGVAISLSLSLVFGLFIPFVIYGLFVSDQVFNFLILLFAGVALSFIFTALSFYISMLNNDRIKGFGFAILLWLYLAIIYDGLMLLFFVSFNDYPLEHAAIGLTILNPIDLCRVAVVLKLDIAALMGYTGAVFSQFFGSFTGIILSFVSLGFWLLIPLMLLLRRSSKKDF